MLEWLLDEQLISPAAAWYLMFVSFLVFALVERKNEKCIENKYRSAEGRNADYAVRLVDSKGDARLKYNQGHDWVQKHDISVTANA